MFWQWSSTKFLWKQNTQNCPQKHVVLQVFGRRCWILLSSAHCAVAVLGLAAMEYYTFGKRYGKTEKMPLRTSGFLDWIGRSLELAAGHWLLPSAASSCADLSAEWSCAASHLGWYLDTHVDLVCRAAWLPGIFILVGSTLLNYVCHDFWTEFFNWSPA